MGQELSVLIKDAGLEPEKEKALTENFQACFALAAEWEEKAKTIVVTDASQTTDMKIARLGRLALREKRIDIEKTRKRLKEQSLREGKAIDAIANTLKRLIEPIEEYLDQQEHYVELKAAKEAAEKAEREKKEAEAKAEEERIAREAAEREERERIRIENERLRKEKEEADRLRQEAEKKAADEKRAADEKVRQEQLKTQQAEEAKRKAEADRKAAIERTRIIQERKNQEVREVRKENIQLHKKIENLIRCPKCGHEFPLQK